MKRKRENDFNLIAEAQGVFKAQGASKSGLKKRLDIFAPIMSLLLSIQDTIGQDSRETLPNTARGLVLLAAINGAIKQTSGEYEGFLKALKAEVFSRSGPWNKTKKAAHHALNLEAVSRLSLAEFLRELKSQNVLLPVQSESLDTIQLREREPEQAAHVPIEASMTMIEGLPNEVADLIGAPDPQSHAFLPTAGAVDFFCTQMQLFFGQFRDKHRQYYWTYSFGTFGSQLDDLMCIRKLLLDIQALIATRDLYSEMALADKAYELSCVLETSIADDKGLLTWIGWRIPLYANFLTTLQTQLFSAPALVEKNKHKVYLGLNTALIESLKLDVALTLLDAENKNIPEKYRSAAVSNTYLMEQERLSRPQTRGSTAQIQQGIDPCERGYRNRIEASVTYRDDRDDEPAAPPPAIAINVSRTESRRGSEHRASPSKSFG